jgi:hypothetical protein
MPTPARFYALQWFHDHEAHGPDSVIGRRPPTTRMRRLMLKEGEVENQPVGQFKFRKWRLTPAGREKLQTKPPPRRSRSMPDADDSKRKQDGQSTP